MTPNEEAARDALNNMALVLGGVQRSISETITMLETPAAPADPGLVLVDTTGKTNVTKGIQDVLDKAKELGTAAARFVVTIPPGDYLVDAVVGLWNRGNTHIKVDPQARFHVMPNAEPNARLWRYYKVDNWEHQGGQYYGDRDEHNYVILQPDKLPNDGLNTHEWGHCFAVGGCKNWSIHDTYIEGFGGDAASVGAWKEGWPWVRSSNGIIENNTMKDCRRQGISATNCDNVTIRKNRIVDIGQTNGTSPRCGIDAEPDNDEIKLADGTIKRPGTILGRCTNLTIEDNDIDNSRVYAVNLFLRIDNVKVINNRMTNSDSCGIVSVQATGLALTGNTIETNNSEGAFIKKDTTQFDVSNNKFVLNYQKQSPVARPQPVIIEGPPTGHRDLYVVVPANGTVGKNSYA